MDYREKAVRCVRETVLPVQAAQFRACGCDLDAPVSYTHLTLPTT